MGPRRRFAAALMFETALAAACVLVFSGCLSPGELDDPEEFLARIGGGDGGVRDGSVAGGKGGSGATSGDGGEDDDMCDAVVTDLMKTCVASVCHGKDSGNALNLEGSGLPDRLVGQKSSAMCKQAPYIDPDAPEKSLLLQKLTAKPPCGSPMPLGGKTPTDAQRACVLEWIMDATDSGGMPSTSGNDAGMSSSGAACEGKDSDKDGTGDCDDQCVNDAKKTKPGVCGCGKPEDDTDGDGALDCEDDCPNDPAKMTGMCDKPGLLVGTLAGNPNTTDDNPGNMNVDPLGPSATEKLDWPEQTTFVFTGKIHITSSGAASFYENVDDCVRLKVDGQMILSNDVWDEPTAGTIMRAEGWYDFDLRVSNGGSASGPSGGMGLGFGYSPMNRNGSTNAADYKHPANMNETSGDLFTTQE